VNGNWIVGSVSNLLDKLVKRERVPSKNEKPEKGKRWAQGAVNVYIMGEQLTTNGQCVARIRRTVV